MSATLQSAPPRTTGQSATARAKDLLTVLNLHFAGVALLGLLNLYLLLHMVYAYQQAHSQNEDAVAQQMILLKAAELGAMPLQGLDAKLAEATTQADAFYVRRLPSAYSELLTELGALARREHVKLSNVQYAQAAVLGESAGELTEVKMDANLSGDYRPLVIFMNSLERDRMFFLISNIALTGQQSGTVNLRLRLTTYLRARAPGETLAPLAKDANSGSEEANPMSAARAVASQAAEQRKKIIAGSAFVVVAAGILYFELADPSPKAPAPAAANVAPIVAPSTAPRTTANALKSGELVTTPPGNAAGAAARTVGNTSAALDPTLHMQAMLVTESVVYNGTGRNIFASGGAPTTPLPVIPKPVTPVRTNTPAPAAYVPSGPPPPPPIDLKFFGTATNASGRRQAFLLHGDDVFLAADGEIVQRKYKVITVSARSVKVEDLTNNNVQTLPLIGGTGAP